MGGPGEGSRSLSGEGGWLSGAPSGREEAEHAGEGVGGAEARGKMAAGLSRPEQARSDFADFSNFGFADFSSLDFTAVNKGLAFSDYFYVYSWTYREI